MNLYALLITGVITPVPSILLTNSIFSLLINFGHFFCENGFIKGLDCWFTYYCISLFPLVWIAGRVSFISGSRFLGRIEWMNVEKKREFGHWISSLSNWLPFLFYVGLCLSSSATAWTPALSNLMSVALLSKPSHTTMPYFSNFSFFLKKIHFAGLMLVTFTLIWWFLALQTNIHLTQWRV